MRCTQTAEAGAYVLGALSPAERSAYERHIAACVTCRNEVAELAGLPGLLGRLDADTAASIGQPEGAPEKLLHTEPALLAHEFDHELDVVFQGRDSRIE